MNTVIVPVDFSETSLNAAKYAAQLLVGHYGVTILFYHHYTKTSEGSEAEAKLQELKEEMMSKHIVKMDTLAHHGGDFVDDLDKAVRHRKADLVIMGITGRSAIAQIVIGSNTLRFAEKRVCPVLIVPEGAAYKEVKNAMLASDFKNVYNSIPSGPIKDFLKTFRPKLHVVNVDSEHYIALTESYQKEVADFEAMFEEFKPEFYFMRLFDVDEALNMFAESKDIDLMIVTHKHHSFFDKIFKGTHTRKLSYQSLVPILVVHE